MSWLTKGITYARQLFARSSSCSQCITQVDNKTLLVESMRCRSVGPEYKFPAPSPYKTPGPNRHGYKQNWFDGGSLPRGIPTKVHALKPYRVRKTWGATKALYGRNDNIDILGDTDLTPRDLLRAPAWLKGFNGNEMQRLIRLMGMEGHKIRQLYPTYYNQNWRRIKYLYKKYNQHRGKPITNVIGTQKVY
ncbi:39S ribosomal protein L51, mitochondrial-like isoform X1 [Dreissena polymorpha]|uniref:Large ribosomal subunit protein mL51 n=1 Tax=Dreissena polymorpha TaxID=45954 RepID=A0A9D4RMY7_DREPO|nr:39S ribosomal protein L51, mitochondrial-like isoform X1 [Dreissena polymorpha]XP_052267521.1 39S ribosomal protein L51, mitochondrial-like isoform X1 [Dreissena polymorpha]XP_052267522.1 39S ribosomal protein L51, mitochondrial-like isoform X1 [Dreissena polymorpha]XP_052267523.1 39S ribosomal protein L51, mitochondrial-like isoform X1 [Dreissena polymorpha]KAH3874319.1 hypothetical protein DPMN_037561 [Dreissena polymorpha]